MHQASFLNEGLAQQYEPSVFEHVLIQPRDEETAVVGARQVVGEAHASQAGLILWGPFFVLELGVALFPTSSPLGSRSSGLVWGGDLGKGLVGRAARGLQEVQPDSHRSIVGLHEIQPDDIHGLVLDRETGGLGRPVAVGRSKARVLGLGGISGPFAGQGGGKRLAADLDVPGQGRVVRLQRPKVVMAQAEGLEVLGQSPCVADKAGVMVVTGPSS